MSAAPTFTVVRILNDFLQLNAMTLFCPFEFAASLGIITVKISAPETYIAFLFFFHNVNSLDFYYLHYILLLLRSQVFAVITPNYLESLQIQFTIVLLLRSAEFDMKEYINLFVERLSELMSEQNLTNFGLSKKINCQDDVIANWRDGKYYPSLKSLISLSTYFECSADFILGLTDDESYKIGKEKATFADRYKGCRQTVKMTDYKVAKICGIQQSTISQWLINGRLPETENLVSLSKLFGCSVEYLLGRTDS